MMLVVRVLADFLNYLLSVLAHASWSMCAVDSARETEGLPWSGPIPGEPFGMCVEITREIGPRVSCLCTFACGMSCILARAVSRLCQSEIYPCARRLKLFG